MQTLTDIDTLRAVTSEAARIFTDHGRHLAAMAYLRQRGIRGDHLNGTWLLGYAPPGWTRLVDKLAGRYPDQALLDSGLAHRCSRGTLIDAFRDRIIFGIRDANGHLVGFIGRDLAGSASSPKYLNTRHSPLFDKSHLLYGLHEGTQPKSRQVVVVEGPLDVLAITDRAASTDSSELLPVAACGTAFTAHHTRLVTEAAFKTQSPVVVAMDGDNAGRTASLHIGEQLRRAGLDVRIAMLPNGTDPCEYLSHSGSSIDTLTYDNATPLLTVHVENAIANQGDRTQWIEGRLAAARSIARYLASYPPSYAARQVPWIAQAVQLNAETVTQELANAYSTASTPDPRAKPIALGI